MLQKMQKNENGENVLFCVYACDASITAAAGEDVALKVLSRNCCN